MNLDATLAAILFVLGALSVTTLFLAVAMLYLLRRFSAMERVVYQLASKEMPQADKRPLSALAVSLVLASTALASPREAVAAAYRDIRTVPGELRKYTRYLTDYPNAHDPKTLASNARLGDFWVNSLSREPDLKPMHRVRGTTSLYRINLLDYRYPLKVWEKLADSDPYFHTQVEAVKKIPGEGKDGKPVEYEEKAVEWEGGVWPGDKTYYEKGAFRYWKKVPKAGSGDREEVVRTTTAQAVGVDPKEIVALVKECNTQAPILRLDWFLVETSQQTERQGTGYYDFLEIKSRKDFDALSGLDQKLAEKFQREVRAIVQFSGVALNNRQIIRFQTITGGYWLTLDVVKQAKRADNERRNAVRNLNGDFVHDAEEGYGVGANGLFLYWAGDAKGNRQDSVPDNVASDKVSPGNEARIHPYGCVSCHKEGIRPINDFARTVYRKRATIEKGDTSLSGPDYEKQKRLHRLYLTDLEGKVRADQEAYARTLYGLNQMKPEELANEWTRLQKGYRERPLGLEDVAREFGVTKMHLQASLMVAALTLQQHGHYTDPSFVALLDDPPIKMRREYLEELFAEGMLYTMGVVRVPTQKPKDTTEKGKE